MEPGSTEEEVPKGACFGVSQLFVGLSQLEGGDEGAALSQLEAGQEESQFLPDSTLGGGTQGEVFSLQLG
jgi:hypothetical protein